MTSHSRRERTLSPVSRFSSRYWILSSSRKRCTKTEVSLQVGWSWKIGIKLRDRFAIARNISQRLCLSHGIVSGEVRNYNYAIAYCLRITTFECIYSSKMWRVYLRAALSCGHTKCWLRLLAPDSWSMTSRTKRCTPKKDEKVRVKEEVWFYNDLSIVWAREKRSDYLASLLDRPHFMNVFLHFNVSCRNL